MKKEDNTILDFLVIIGLTAVIFGLIGFSIGKVSCTVPEFPDIDMDNKSYVQYIQDDFCFCKELGFETVGTRNGVYYCMNSTDIELIKLRDVMK